MKSKASFRFILELFLLPHPDQTTSRSVCVCVCAFSFRYHPLFRIHYLLQPKTHKHTLDETLPSHFVCICLCVITRGNTVSTGNSAHALGPRHGFSYLSFSVWGLQPLCKYQFLTQIIELVFGWLSFTIIL